MSGSKTAAERYGRAALFLIAAGFFVFFGGGAVWAQENDGASNPSATLGELPHVAELPTDQVAPELLILRSIEKEIEEKYKNKVFQPSGVPSMVFTPSQYALLREARVGFNTRVPTAQELKDLPDPNDPNYRPPPSLREINLQGIAFINPDDWTIWLNKKRVTPDALPSEAVDLRVYKEFIELKWYDAQTNQIYPIRLRPNQTFHIDSRIFLPG
jgi:hypothetical protein